MKKIFALLLAAALLLSFVGCGYNPAVVVTVDGEDIPAGVYLYYQYLAYNDAKYALGNVDDSPLGQTIGETPAREWIHASVVGRVKNYVFAGREFEKRGLEFSESALTYYNQQIESDYANNAATYKNLGVGLESYRLAELADYKLDSVFMDIYGADGDEPVSDEEARDYIDHNMLSAETVIFTLVDSEYKTFDEQTKEKQRGYAREFIERANAGEDPKALAKELCTYAIQLAGYTYQVDDSNISYFYNAELLISKEYSYFVGDLNEKVFENFDYNEYVIIEGEEQLVVCKRSSLTADSASFAYYKSASLRNMRADEWDAFTANGISGYAVEEDAKAVKHFSPDKVYEVVDK